MALNDPVNRNKGATEVEFVRNYIFCGFRLTQYARNTVPVTWFRFKILLWCSFFNPEAEFFIFNEVFRDRKFTSGFGIVS